MVYFTLWSSSGGSIKSFLLLALSLLATLSWSSPPTIDFVIDIDSTIVSSVYEGLSYPFKTIEIADGGQTGRFYRLINGAPEFLQKLSEIPGARISFFSADNLERNKELLSKITLPNGRTAADIAFKVLSGQDAVEKTEASVPRRKEFKFLFRDQGVKKDLTTVSPDLKLENAILIDDIVSYAAIGQEKNILWVPGDLHASDHDKDSLHEIIARDVTNGSVETAKFEYFADNKLAYAMGRIDESLEHAHRTGRSVPDVLWEKQFKMGENRIEMSDSFWNIRYLRKGAAILKTVNPKFQTVPLIPRGKTINCSSQLLNHLLHTVLSR